MSADEAAAENIVRFWLGPDVEGPDVGGPEQAEERRAVWYHGGDAVDQQIRDQFAPWVERACCGKLDDWANTAQGALALVITLDQFTRNIFRATPRAYAGDARALEVADQAIADGLDRGLPVTGRIFLYHPFHHAESLLAQNRAVALIDSIRRDVPAHWHEFLDRRVAGFSRHRDIIVRFGRFPHRNAILERDNTADEAIFLKGEYESLAKAADHWGHTDAPRRIGHYTGTPNKARQTPDK